MTNGRTNLKIKPMKEVHFSTNENKSSYFLSNEGENENLPLRIERQTDRIT